MKKLATIMSIAILLVSVLGTVTIPVTAAESDNYVAAHWKFQNEEGNFTGSIENDDFRFIDLTGNGNDLEVRSEGFGDELDIFEWDEGVEFAEGGYSAPSSLKFGNTWEKALSVDPYTPEQTAYSGAFVSGKYLQTVDGAPLNSVDSTTGWTVEVIFKIDEEWNNNYNRYTGIFSRQGVVETQDEPAFSMAITELINGGSQDGYLGTEGTTGLQYVHVDVNEVKTNHEFKNGEMYGEQWIHYMVTCDGGYLDVFINGENVLSMVENNEIYITDNLFSWEVGVGRKTGFNKDTNSDHATMNPKHPEGLIRRLFCGSIAEIRFSMNYMEIEDSLLYANLSEQETDGAETEGTQLLENNFIYNYWNEDIAKKCFSGNQTTIEATEEGIKFTGVTSDGVDPFVTIKLNEYQNMVNADAFKAEEYPYVIFKFKSEGTNEECQFFYNSSPSEDNSEKDYYSADGEWQYLVFDLSYCDGWLNQRRVTTVRFDWATNYVGAAEDAYMLISDIAFFKTEEEANIYMGIDPETEAPETEAPAETEAPETEAPAETEDKVPETEAPKAGGCASVVGFGSVAVLMAAAAVVALKKKD